MPLLYPSQHITRYISTAKWPQGLEPVFFSNVDTVWPIQPVSGPERKNPVITTNTNALSVSKMEEHRYLYRLRTRVDQSLPDTEDKETLEPWTRLPAEGFQFHESTRLNIWPSDSYNIATRVLATASIFATLALSSYNGVFSVFVTEYRNPNSPELTNAIPTTTNNNTRDTVSAYEALGPNGSIALLYKDFLPDGDEGNFQRRVLTYFWFDHNVFTTEILDAFTATQRAPREGPLKLIGTLRDWIWTRCNMNDTQFWCLGTGEQMLFGWCDWNSKTVYTTKRFACDEHAPTLLEMTIYWIVEAFTEHPDLADWHQFPGSTGVKAKCNQVSHIAGWMPTIAMDGQVVTDHPGLHNVINTSGGMGMGMDGTASNTSNTNATTGTSTITAHSHIPITNASTSNATVSGSPNPAAPSVNRKRRLEEEEEADNDRHRTQRRKLTHLYEPVSDGYESGYESSHQGRYYRNRIVRPMDKDLHRDLRQAVSQVAISGGHRPTSRPASKSASKARNKRTSRRSKRRMSPRSVSIESYCDCEDPNCEKPLYIPITVGPGTGGRPFDVESSSDSSRCSPAAYMELYMIKQQQQEAEAARQAAAEADHSPRHSGTPSTTALESFEEIADISWEWADDPNLSEEQRQVLSNVVHEPETFSFMLKYFRAENEVSMQRPLANSLIVAAQKDPSETRDILKNGIIPEEDRDLLPALPPQPVVAAATGPGGVGASGDFSRAPSPAPAPADAGTIAWSLYGWIDSFKSHLPSFPSLPSLFGSQDPPVSEHTSSSWDEGCKYEKQLEKQLEELADREISSHVHRGSEHSVSQESIVCQEAHPDA